MGNKRSRDWQNFFQQQDIEDYVELPDNASAKERDSIVLEYFNAKIREALEAAPKVYGEKCDKDDEFHWSEMPNGWATHTGRIIDVKPIEREKP